MTPSRLRRAARKDFMKKLHAVWLESSVTMVNTKFMLCAYLNAAAYRAAGLLGGLSSRGASSAGWARGRFSLVLAVATVATPVLGFDGITRPLRELAAHEQEQYKGVGRLDLGEGYCTATLFTESHAITAAHCMFDSSGKPRRTADMWFRAGFRHGRYQAVRQITRTAIHPDYRWNGPYSSFREIAADVALVELDQPILTTSIPNYHPGALPQPGGPVALLSYGRGRDHALSLQDPCKVTAVRGPVAQLDCNAVPGTSGSPVLVRDGRALKLAGVISSGGGTRSYAAVTAATLPLLLQELAKQDIGRKADRPTGSDLSGKTGAWKTSRPPAE